MQSASWPRDNRLEERLLVIDAKKGAFYDQRIKDLSQLLRPHDLLIVNDAATLPASLRAGDVEMRLLGHEDDGSWRAVLFGPGDWHTPTEKRTPPRRVQVGERLTMDSDFYGVIEAVAPESARLVSIRFNVKGAELWSAFYKHGHMIQYSYLKRELKNWSTQTSYSTRPWAAEMPSAGRPLSAGLLLDLKRKGIEIASLTHAAGLSSTGQAALDQLLPLRERYDIPQRTIDAIARARQNGGRIIAVGTSVVRALEGSAANNSGKLVAGEGETDLVIGRSPTTPTSAAPRPPIADALLSGMHESAESHYLLLQTFAPASVLDESVRIAAELGYLMHEFGDSCLIF
ncbi:MAG: S-adenosylmethionine:tRNA ribosyltransferase-isomerase [Deltaproteobacteria bacterium]|nr:S-adenosylmethionine:tRNA ribosyltransferase-isomerase [Deltaproteobacteria bacterium]